MKLNSIRMILLLLILTFAISAVSAQDTSDNVLEVNDLNDNGMISSIEDNELYSFSEDNQQLKADNSQTFTDLRNKITTDLGSGTVITLTSNYTFDESTDSVGAIAISKANVVIDGNGFTIDGAGKTSIFTLSGRGITLKNITFINAYGNGGSAVTSSGANAQITGCNFINCTSSFSYGGAIRITGAGSLIDDCTFINNTVPSTSSYSYGGAVYSSSNGGIINNSRFESNHANRGGAVYLYNYAQIIDNCNFTSNYVHYSGSSNYFGGAVYVSAGNSKIRNSNFVNNSANKYGHGGAIYGYGEIDGCNFTNNTAYRGGAIFAYASNTGITLVNNSNFVNNSATLAGGAITNYMSNRPIVVDQSTFIANRVYNPSGSYGGAIYTYASSSYNNITNSKFEFNYAQNLASAIYSSGAYNLVENCTFFNNTAQRGTIYSSANNNYPSTADHVYNNLVFIDNYAHEGSAFYITGNQKYTISNTLMLNNTAGNYTMELSTVLNGHDVSITSTFLAQDNLLNAIRVRPDADMHLKNVTYWGMGGIRNTGPDEVGQIDGADDSQGGTLVYNDDREAFVNTTIVVIYQGDEYISRWDDVFDDVNLWSNDTILSDNNLFQNYEFDGYNPFEDMQIIAKFTNTTDIYGNIYLNLSKLPGGKYTVVTFHNQDKYYDYYYTEVKQFELKKLPDFITIDGENITVGEKEVLEVNLPEDISGILTVKIGNDSYPVRIYRGNGILVVRDLPAGEYTANVTFDGDYYYDPVSNSTKFTVSKLDPEIKVIDQGNGTVVITSANDATGNITVNVNGTPYTFNLTNGTAVVNLNNNAPGNYNITVSYPGDSKYNPNITKSKANIPKYETPINVTADSIFVGDNATVIVSVPSNATGNITIEINGKKYSNLTFVNGTAKFTVENLSDGNKTIHVSYGGDDWYLANATSGQFEVKKRPSNITVNASSTVVGNKTIITVNVPGNATGQVLIDIDGQKHYINVTNGTGSVDVGCLDDGEYDINATYLGDYQYLPSNNVTKVKISKSSSFVNASADNITVGESAVINITVPKDATGNVTVTITDDKGNNIFTKDIPVDNGAGQLIVPDLQPGNYTVNVEYNGNRRFDNSSSSTNFTVKKADMKDLTVIDLGNGTVKIVALPCDATGNVTVKVGDNNYTGKITNGIATVDLDNEIPGNHNITVSYPGDSKYNSIVTNANVTIPKYETPINVTADSIFVGDNATVVVRIPNNATGNITIEINGKKYSNLTFVNGTAKFTVENLSDGNKTIHVIYNGDDFYLANATSGQFEVKKRPSNITITTVPSIVENKTTISVNVPGNATGQVLIDIDGQQHYINITNGTGSVDVGCLGEGEYDINATYLGDYQYLASNNVSKVKVSKSESFVSADVDNITVGENAVINITVPKEATGNVTVTITDDNGNNIFTKDIPVDNGVGQLIVPDLQPGNYTVNVEYNGNRRFDNSSSSTNFTVKKADMKDLTVIDLGNGTVKIAALPCDATGNVTVKVGDNNYTGKIVNGIATIDLDKEAAGKHNITVSYPGDDRHNAFEKNDSVIIPKRPTPISVKADPIYVGEDAKITVDVPKGATGEVTIEIDGREFTSTIKDGKAVFTVPDLLEGDRTIAVKYSGDDGYVENFTTGQFTVSKRPTKTTVSVKDIVYGDDAVITVHVTKGTTGNVLVDVDGVGYYAKVINGIARVVVPNLKVGNHIVSATYDGDEKYLKSSASTVVKVTQSRTVLRIENDTIPVGDNGTVVVHVPKDATGTVTIKVNNKVYTVKVKNGKAVFSVPDLPVGNHTVYASYSGDENYDAYDVLGWIYVYDDSYPPVEKDSPSSHNEVPAKNNDVPVTPNGQQPGNPILALLLAMVMIIPFRRKL